MYRPGATIAIAALAVAAHASADENDQAQASRSSKLDTVLVTAARQSGVPVNTPSPVFSIDRAALDDITVVNPEDALKYAPNLHVRKRFIGDNNGIVSVRSTSSRQSARTLVYADGLLLSNFLGSDFSFPPRWSLVNAEEIRRVDVLYGPYSAQFPGNSMGSTVLITTAMPDTFTTSAGVQYFSQSFDLFGIHETYDGSKLNGFIGDRIGRLAYAISAERLDTQSQPLSFLTAVRSATAAVPDDVPVTGAVTYRDQFGRDGYVFGVNGEGVTESVNDQVKLKVTYDLATTVQLGATVVDWCQQSDNEVESFLRAADGSVVTTGPVAVDGNRYVLAANAFASGNADSHRRLYGISLRSAHPDGWNYSVVASRFDIDSDSTRTATGPGNGPGTITFADGSGWTVFDAQADYQPASLEGSHSFVFGAHADRYELENSTWNTDDWRDGTAASFNNAFAGQTQTSAVFAQDSWAFARGWRLIPGVRYERWRASEGSRAQGSVTLDYPQRSDDYWSPKLALQRDLANGWTARLSLGKAYRMPTVSELFQGRITGTLLVNNDPDLKPEHAFSKDLTFEHKAHKSSLRISVYEDDIRDALFSQTNTTVFPTVTNIQNVDRVRTRGAEVALSARELLVPQFDLDASVAYNNAKTLDNDNFPASVGKFFYRIPDWRADLVGTWRFASWISSTVAARYSGRQYNTLDNTDIHPDTFGGTSRYLVVDAKLGFTLGAHATLSVGAENLNDERYFVYHPYPGRTYYAEARFKFD